MRRALLVPLAATSCLAFLACGGPRPPAAPPTAEPTYRATIRWTSHAVPHIEAGDLGSLAFGQGYAFARHHACVLADQIVKVRSQRARWFGPGPGDRYLDEDFGWLAIGVVRKARELMPELSAETRALIEGYTAGYNHYLAEAGPDALPQACRGEPWVGPIEPVELIAYGLSVNMLASSGAFVDDIGRAGPPGSGAASSDPLPAPPPAGSNAWAIGAERSESGGGLLLANPHFPWFGALTFYESHLTIPGDFDVYGATLMGGPLINIGFDRHKAWTHTFSSSRRFVLYALTLGESATRYRYGDELRDLEAKTYSVQVRGDDGTLRTVERTLYRSHHGPVVASRFLPWTEERAFVLRDAAAEGINSTDQYLAMMRARSLDQLEAALARYQSIPFVNTLAVDAAGTALYVDTSRVPDVPEAALRKWTLGKTMMPELRQAWEAGVMILDGSDPAFELAADPEAVGPGTIPYQRAPRLRRRDFVFNANNSYGYTNPAAPMEGHSILYGEALAPLSPRARMNLVLLTETGEGAAAGADGRFSAAEVEAALLSNRTLTGELLRAEVLGRCERAAVGDPALEPGCDAIAAWDTRVELDSRGVALWRELLATFTRGELAGVRDRWPSYGGPEASPSGALWAEPFDPDRPIATPRGLAPDVDLPGKLRTALERLEAAGVAPSAALGELQYTLRAGQRFPVHGGDLEGTANQAMFDGSASTLLPQPDWPEILQTRTGLAAGGYPIDYGTSFLMIVAYGEDGPRARGLVTYSASSDPRSPHATDQTAMWSREELRPLLYAPEAIAADPALEVQVVSGD